MIKNLIIDGISVSPANEYTFTDVRSDHVLHVVTEKIATDKKPSGCSGGSSAAMLSLVVLTVCPFIKSKQ